MSDSSDVNDTQDGSELDVDAEHEKLDELGERIEDTRHHAEEDLEPGGSGRTFTDEGVRAQVERGGDTHPDAGF